MYSVALYSDVIDQVTVGHRYLLKELGEEARVRFELMFGGLLSKQFILF